MGSRAPWAPGVATGRSASRSAPHPVRPDPADQRQGRQRAEGDEPRPADRTAVHDRLRIELRGACVHRPEMGERELGGEGRVVGHRPAELERGEQVERDTRHPRRHQPRGAEGVPRRPRPVPPDPLHDEPHRDEQGQDENPPDAPGPGPGQQPGERSSGGDGRRGEQHRLERHRPRLPATDRGQEAVDGRARRRVRRRIGGARLGLRGRVQQVHGGSGGAGAPGPGDNPGPCSALPGRAHEHGLWWALLGSGASQAGGRR